MLQRPQTILFALAFICTLLLAFTPVCSYTPKSYASSNFKYKTEVNVKVSGLGISPLFDETDAKSKQKIKEIEKINERMSEDLSEESISIVFLIGLVGTLLLAGLILATLLVFKKRGLQAKLGIASFLIIVFVGIMLFALAHKGPEALAFYYGQSSNLTDTIDVNYKLGLFLPIIAAICMIVGVILVRKDDNLVKSVDRIR